MAGASSGISLVLAATSRWARAVPVVEDRQQVHLAAVGPDGAADGLAVGGRLLQQARRLRPGPGGAALLALVPGECGQLLRGTGRQGRQIAAHGRVEGLRVDAGEDPAEGAHARRADPARPRVTAPAQGGHGLL